MSRGNSLLGGTSIGPSPEPLKIWDQPEGCHQPAGGGGTHIYAMHAGGTYGFSVARLGVKSVRVNSAFHPSGYRYTSKGPYQGP